MLPDEVIIKFGWNDEIFVVFLSDEEYKQRKIQPDE